MQFRKESNGQIIEIDLTSSLGSGGEAKIYTLIGDETLAAKIYHKPEKVNPGKLLAMRANPPDDPMKDQNHVSFAWPLDLIKKVDSTRIVGFLMPRIQGFQKVADIYNPRTRRRQTPMFNYLYLHRAARNLASVLRSLHARGYVIGDLNESNIIVSDTALVTLVDTDSFQVPNAPGGTSYRCPVGKLEYTPPELQGAVFPTIDRTTEHDLFGMAVIIFKLLMEGTHPFEGVYQRTEEPPPYEERIARGHFPYGTKSVPYTPKPSAPDFSILSPKLRQLFIQCFEAGFISPQNRPSAQDWQNALSEAEELLSTCVVNEQHRYGNHLKSCPWCQRTAQLGGWDPFPSPRALKQTRHSPQKTTFQNLLQNQLSNQINPNTGPVTLVSSVRLLLGGSKQIFWLSTVGLLLTIVLVVWIFNPTIFFNSTNQQSVAPLNSEEKKSQPIINISEQFNDNNLEEIGPNSVWKPKDEQWELIHKKCNLGHGNFETNCILREMKNAGASQEAIAFSKLRNGEVYLSSFKEMGRVDIAEITEPVLNSPDVTDFIFVNGKPKIIEPWKYINDIDITKDPNYEIIVRNNYQKLQQFAQSPDINPPYIWPMGGFVGMSQSSNGGQKFFFEYSLQSCHACGVAGSALIVFDFDKSGILQKTELVGLNELNDDPNNAFVVVTQNEAFFKFSIEYQNQYEWYDKGLQYAWSIKIKNNNQDYELGYYLFTASTQSGKGAIKELIKAGQFSLWKGNNVESNVVSNALVEGILDENYRLTVKLKGSQIIQTVFSERPKYVSFNVKMLEKERSKTVQVFYAD